MIYDSSDKKPGLFSSLMQLGFLSVIKSPVISTLLLFLAGALFAGIVMMSYPDSQKSEDRIPTIQADSGDIKSVPESRGGMDIPNRDSTVFQAMRGDLSDRPVIENLLEPSSTQEAEPLIDLSAELEEPTASETPVQDDLTAPTKTSAASPKEEEEEKPDVKPEPQQKPETKVQTAESSETIDYVRSVLKEEKAPEPVKEVEKPAPVAKKVEPAPSAPAAVESGSYYVQIVSVKSEDAANSEWKNAQKKYSVLSGLKYRVVRADLGAKGIYYRLQAGGLSKSSAESVCNAIKSKSGSCLVVK